MRTGVPPPSTHYLWPGLHHFSHWNLAGWEVSITLVKYFQAQSLIWWFGSLLREAEQGLWATCHRARDKGPERLRNLPNVTQLAEPKAGSYRSVKFKGNSEAQVECLKDWPRISCINVMVWYSPLPILSQKEQPLGCGALPDFCGLTSCFKGTLIEYRRPKLVSEVQGSQWKSSQCMYKN